MASDEKSPRLGICLDIGSTATKLVVLGADGAVSHTDLMPTGFSSVDEAARALASLETAGERASSPLATGAWPCPTRTRW